jgi:transposase
VDESGVNLAMTRPFGRAPRGERVTDAAPQNYGENVTLLGALSLSGVEALMTVNGATDSDIFLAFVREVLAPTLRAGDVVIWDNLGAHRSQVVREAVEARGATVTFLPPYSPDFNPIERCWSKIKTYLRAAKARTREALEAAIKRALSTVTESDARAWFNHCGYAVN